MEEDFFVLMFMKCNQTNTALNTMHVSPSPYYKFNDTVQCKK